MLPDDILTVIAGYTRKPLIRKTYQAHITFLDAPDRPPAILKSAKGLSAEAERLGWLASHAPVPSVIAFASGDTDHLVMTRLPGVDGTDTHGSMSLDDFVRELAEALRRFHAIPIDACPFHLPTDALLLRAEAAVTSGAVRQEHLSPLYAGETPLDLLRTIHTLRTDDLPPVMGHGDPSLPNFMFENGTVTGYIDPGLAGVSDPWRDLAIVARSLAWNIGATWIRPFCEAYGVEPDHRRLRFWQLMDEFLMSRGWMP